MLSKLTKQALQANYLYMPIYYCAQSAKDVPAQKSEVKTNYKTPDYEKVAYLEYKKQPDHISHFNKKSPDYVHSELDEYHANSRTNSYNYLIDRLKSDLTMQKKVHDILRKMDRPYLRGLPGTTRNVAGGVKDLFPQSSKVPKGQAPEVKASAFLEANYRNENRWVDQSVYYPKYAKMTHYDVDYQNELNTRPVNKHFHHDKGYKYDVETPYAQRYEYLADRLGHPEIMGTPYERLMRLESEVYHPNFLDQPFVKMPTGSPHPSLNFEEGEVVYENSRLLEWSKFWNYSIIFGYLWAAFFVPFNLLFKTHMPVEYGIDNLFVPWFQHSMYFWDNNALHVPVVSLVAGYATFLAMSYINTVWKDYVVKMQYSKDKELIFVTRISPYGSTDREVYEAAHLQILPPSIKSGVQFMSNQDADGLWDVTCLSSQRLLTFYNENKYWNPQLKKEFFDRTMNLWTKDYVGYNRVEQQEREISERITLGGGDSDSPKLEKK